MSLVRCLGTCHVHAHISLRFGKIVCRVIAQRSPSPSELVIVIIFRTRGLVYTYYIRLFHRRLWRDVKPVIHRYLRPKLQRDIYT